MRQKRYTYTALIDDIKADWLFNPETKPGTRLPTGRDLQKRYGASRATVSKAMAILAGDGLITTRAGSGTYVNAIASEPAPGGSQLVGTKLVGYVAPMLPNFADAPHTIARQIYEGIECRAGDMGYQVLTASAHFDLSREEALVEQFIQLGAHGIILYPVDYPGSNRRNEPEHDYLAQRWPGTPIIVVDNGADEWNRPMVQFDNFTLGLDMTNRLLDEGRRHILFMHTAPERLHNSVHDRQKGWIAAHARRGLAAPRTYVDWPLEISDFDGADGIVPTSQLVESILTLEPRPDALIAWEDDTAMRLSTALLAAGLDVPSAIRVAGFDNVTASTPYEPAFPTSVADFRRMGEVALEVLDSMLKRPSDNTRTYLLPASVCWREASK